MVESSYVAAGSTFVRPLFERESPLSSLGDGLVAMRFQQLPGEVMNVDFLHQHGVMLLFVGATVAPHYSPRR